MDLTFRQFIESAVVDVTSPLDYHGVHPARIAIYDMTVPPADKKDTYFKPKGLVAFLDYSRTADGIYIHYMSTRYDQRKKGYMNILVNHLYDTNPDIKEINFGQIHHDAVEKIFLKKKAEGKIYTRGKL